MELTDVQKRTLRGYFKDEEIIKTFEEESEKDIVEYLISELYYSKTRLINFHNKQVAKSIDFFVGDGEWGNLNRIMRSLPSEIKRTKKDERARLIVDKSADLIDKFMNLPLKEKEKIMNDYEQTKEEENE